MQNSDKKIYYGALQIEGETAYLGATKNGLCWAGGFNEDFHSMETWMSRQLRDFTLVKDQEELSPYVEQFKAFYRGERKEFDFPLHLQGTDFQRNVWNALQQIPYGESVTYSDIADEINHPTAIRAVGSAVSKNPVLVVVPCHRVINKNGKLGGFRGGIPLKRKLQQIEKQHVHDL